ncbi:phosphotransferase family protein [Terribacillus saccharophilus]|uniref:phosphotransferase family protein n=1 Tax=Terribacillus saccharophilus TaxID=361277 RepID=UPI0015962A3E|nr:aminoglycoside phosphotransferase family protein [Terribacillus saccharophilus]
MDKLTAAWLEGHLQEPIRQVEAINSGWDHDVYVLNGHWILRLPKKDVTINREEEKLLKNLQNKTNIALPAFTICTTPECREAMLYPYIPGHPVSANMLDVSLENIAGQLGVFLTRLHQLDVTSYSLPKRDRSYYETLYQKIRSFYPELPAFVIHHTERLFAELQPVCTAVVHGDLRSAHILWEKSNSQVGIIDFSDMHIGDPAIDFVGISQISSNFLNQVLCKYEAADKEAICQRAAQLAKLGLYYELIEYGPSCKLATEMERQFM